MSASKTTTEVPSEHFIQCPKVCLSSSETDGQGVLSVLGFRKQISRRRISPSSRRAFWIGESILDIVFGRTDKRVFREARGRWPVRHAPVSSRSIAERS